MDNDTTITPLKDLHQLLGDSCKGYRAAAERMEEPRLGAFLNKLSNERDVMRTELAAAIHQLQPKLEKLDDGTLKGDMHRTWIDIREALASSEDAAILDECDRGEGYLLKRFKTVLDDKDTPPGVIGLLREQKSRVDVTISTIQQLRETVKA